MSDLNSLLKRIDDSFAKNEARVKSFQAEQTEAYHARQQRLEEFGRVCERLKGVWGPRLQSLVDRFRDRVQVTPSIAPTQREAALEFESNLARIKLKFSASTDRDVRKLVLDYRLDLIPVLMQYKQHDHAEFPLEAIDESAVAQWIDDRIVDFVETYLSLGENEYYLKDHMVEDPVAGVRFPKFAAAATLDWNRRTYYFICEDTRNQFAKEQGVT